MTLASGMALPEWGPERTRRLPKVTQSLEDLGIGPRAPASQPRAFR